MGRRQTAVLLATGLVIFTLAARGAEEPTPVVAELQARIAELEAQVQNLRAQIKTVRQQNAKLVAEGFQLKKGLQTAEGKLAKLLPPEPAPRVTDESKPSGENPYDGFRGLIWGSALGARKDLVAIPSDDALTYYKRPDEKMTIGQAKIRELTYVAYKGQMCAVAIRTEGESSFSALKRAIEARFGRGEQPNEFISKWSWLGATSGRDQVIMTLELNEITDAGLWHIIYVPIFDVKARDEKKAAARAATHDF